MLQGLETATHIRSVEYADGSGREALRRPRIRTEPAGVWGLTENHKDVIFLSANVTATLAAQRLRVHQVLDEGNRSAP